ncbi:MAG TPA: pyridoxamine 5'-phosphate oxidase family protein [Chthoniobacterales bacterium]|jgi:general stress protein 26
MNPFSSLRQQENLEIADNDDLVALARKIINERHLGVLTTVDSENAPHARWMATLTLDTFPRLLTLTAAHSAKVRHIRVNPQVDWLFANEDFTVALNLRGTAQVHVDTVTIKRAWKIIEDKSHLYFLNTFDGKFALAVVETEIERIDYTAAEAGIRLSHFVMEPVPVEA